MQAEALDLELSVQETLERSATDAQLNDIKALLGRMMFTGKAVHKKVRRCAAPQEHHCSGIYWVFIERVISFCT